MPPCATTEETGVAGVSLRQVGAFTDPGRHPGDRVVSVAFTGDLPAGVQPLAGDDAAEVWLCPLSELPDLAFDHAEMIDAAIRLRG